MEPAGLYIHVPFGTSVCPYCDFAVTIAGGDRRRRYLDALELEIGRAREGETELTPGRRRTGGDVLGVDLQVPNRSRFEVESPL
ncbi:MAG TPA: hypothetical protein VLT32_24310, partial [Candidatus Sulfomarinibacteraceae bacterium]|nr:hypothetical protein [Candidatus Sulfomarinibacteraceae bacterium]